MPVPLEDIVCRFIDPDKWTKRDKRPNQRAFKQAGLSVWNQNKLHKCGASLEDLLIGRLRGWGQAHHSVEDYLTLAQSVEQEEGIPCKVRVEWRPCETPSAWWEWRYAHVQVEVTEGESDLHLEYRRRLAANSRHVVPPEKYR